MCTNNKMDDVIRFRKSLEQLVGIALDYPDFMGEVGQHNIKIEFMGMSLELEFIAQVVQDLDTMLENYIDEMKA